MPPERNGSISRSLAMQRAERRVPASQALGDGDHVGQVAVALGAEVLAEAAEGADHLVRDEQHAVAVADLADPLEVPGRRREAATAVLHRLQEDRGDGVGALAQDRPLDLVGGPHAERDEVVAVLGCTVEVGVRHLDRAGHERLERRLQRRHPGDRQGAHRRAVVGDVPADHLDAARLVDRLEVLPRELPGGLDRLGAAGREEDAVQVAGGEVGDALGELDAAGVRVGPQREVGELARLLGRGLGKLRAPVADLDGEQPREAVQVTFAVLVVDVRTFAADDDRDVVVLVRAEAREVHPEVAAGRLLELGIGRDAHRVPHV